MTKERTKEKSVAIDPCAGGGGGGGVKYANEPRDVRVIQIYANEGRVVA